MTRLSEPLTNVTVSRGDGVPLTLRARTRGRRRTRRAPRSRRCPTRSQSSRWDLLSQRCLRSIRISPLPHSNRTAAAHGRGRLGISSPLRHSNRTAAAHGRGRLGISSHDVVHKDLTSSPLTKGAVGSRPTVEGDSESRHTTWRTRISPLPHSQRERSRPTAEGYSDTGRLHMDDLARRAAAQARARA